MSESWNKRLLSGVDRGYDGGANLKIRILTEKDQKYFKSPLFVKEYAEEN